MTEGLTAELAALTRRAAPRLRARPGVGIGTAGTLLATAGDNPHRPSSIRQADRNVLRP